MIDKHVIDEMWEFLYTVVSSNHSKYTSQRITDLNPLGSTEFGNDSDGLKPIAKKVTKTKQKSQQHIQDYTGIVHNLSKPVYVCDRMPFKGSRATVASPATRGLSVYATQMNMKKRF